MKLQNFEQRDQAIRQQYLTAKRRNPDKFASKLKLSWSIWMFGIEPLEQSLIRLKKAGLSYVELKGDPSQDPEIVTKVIERHGFTVSGVCGLFPLERDLASPDVHIQDNAVKYVKQEIQFTKAVGGSYFIVVPSAVGRTRAVDDREFTRSAQALRRCGDDFQKAGIKAAVEPIRSAEVSLVHTVDEALQYIEAVDHPGIAHINADTYHMLNEESHVGDAILRCGSRLVNLHVADSNRDAPGKGMMNVDVVIMAAYLVGMNQGNRFITFEPLGPYADPYVLSTQPCKTDVMDQLVRDSVDYFREREEIVRKL